MRSRWRIGLVGLAALGGVAIQACVVAPRPYPYGYRYGYGGSGYSYVDPGVARSQCLHQARDVRGFRGVHAGGVAVTGPETAVVRLHAWGPYAGYDFNCTYNARTGYAYVP